MSKLEDRYKELFHQTPREALIAQIARDIFEARLAHHHWSHLRADYADSVEFSDIATVTAGAVEPYNPALIGKRVLGTALYEFYTGMNEAALRVFVAHARLALKARIILAINRGQSEYSLEKAAARHDPDNGGN